MAAPVGLEPTTYGLTVRRSTNWTTGQYKMNDYICIYRGASHHSRGLLHSYLFSLTTSEVSDLHRLKAYTRSTIQHDLRNYFLVAASTTPKSYRPLGTSHCFPIARRQGTWLSCVTHLINLYSVGVCYAAHSSFLFILL